jgi:hypothetical protein
MFILEHFLQHMSIKDRREDMQTITLVEILFVMSITLFLLGVATFISGAVVLFKRTYNKDIREITEQTSKLAQKGLAHDISGLVGNASSLLMATSDLVKTNSGLGVFLLLLGFFQIAGAILLTLYLYAG